MSDASTPGWPGGPDELSELLSALLDGELAPERDAEVRAFVQISADAADELAGLALVRTAVRDLPAVDPPFGFYERLLLAERGTSPTSVARRRSWPKAVGAFAAAAAAVVLIVGITPATDAVVPPVTAYAARHEQMAASAPASSGPSLRADTTAPVTVDPAPTSSAPGAATSVPSGSVPATTGSVRPSTNPTTTAGAAPTSAASVAPRGTSVSPDAAAGMTFDPMPATELDAMGAPPAMSHDMTRLAGYHGPDGVVHLMYGNGTVTLSVFEQVGTVAWDQLPAAGQTMQVGGDPAWAMNMGGEEILVVARGSMVYTVVMAAPLDVASTMATELPPAPAPSLLDRAQSACRSVVDRFGLTPS